MVFIIFSFIIFSDHIVLVFKLYQTILNHNITHVYLLNKEYFGGQRCKRIGMAAKYRMLVNITYTSYALRKQMFLPRKGNYYYWCERTNMAVKCKPMVSTRFLGFPEFLEFWIPTHLEIPEIWRFQNLYNFRAIDWRNYMIQSSKGFLSNSYFCLNQSQYLHWPM